MSGKHLVMDIKLGSKHFNTLFPFISDNANLQKRKVKIKLVNCAKKVVSYSLGLVDFAIGLVNLVLN